MKKVKFALTTFTLLVAVAGVVVAKANEKKRTTTAVGYFSNSAGTIQVTLDQARFDDASVTNVAKIIDNNNAQKQIFANSDLTGSLKLIP